MSAVGVIIAKKNLLFYQSNWLLNAEAKRKSSKVAIFISQKLAY